MRAKRQPGERTTSNSKRASRTGALTAGICFTVTVVAVSASAAAEFTPEQRRRIDENSLWSPRETLNPSKIEAAGSGLQWLIRNAPLPPDELRSRANKAQGEALERFKPTAAPDEVRAVLKKLVDSLAARMRPFRSEFEIQVADLSSLVLVGASKENVERGHRLETVLIGDRLLLVDREWLESLHLQAAGDIDRLAWAVARELGHSALGHSRRRMQRAWLHDLLRDEARRRSDDVDQVLGFLKGAEGVGVILEYVYSREEEFQADLFGVQLCRNAGFDVERGLDLLRTAAVKDDTKLKDEPPPRDGIPPVEPVVQPQVGPEAVTLAAPPTAAQRLRRLRLELDGRLFGPKWGLFEYQVETKTFERAVDGSVARGRRVVICIHGMESNVEVFRPLIEKLAEVEGEARPRLLAFQYPADDSLGKVGRALANEMRRVVATPAEVDFVCHSAGGLVFRHYAEVLSGEFRSATLIGTPHQGSELARLRRLLEAVQFVGDLKLGYDEALRGAILDGRGQITFDVEPDSLFLTYLNRERKGLHRDRYVIHRGRVLSTAKALLAQTATKAARESLLTSIDRKADPTLRLLARSSAEALTLPAEVMDGDLCVRAASAALDGVTKMKTHTLNHTALPRDATVIDQVIRDLVFAAGK